MTPEERLALAHRRLGEWLDGFEKPRLTPLEEHLWAVRASAAAQRVEVRA